ncbi:MAG: thioredoxin family protein [Campylobacter sp.]|nr:thioredoxin family protein [Campylobacter sp.]
MKKILIALAVILVVVGAVLVKFNTKNYLALETDAVNIYEYASYSVPIMLDFGADECIPCKAMKGDLEQIYKLSQNKAVIKYIDIFKNPSAVSDFEVEALPTQFFINADLSPYKPSKDIGVEFVLHTNSSGEHIYTSHIGPLSFDEMKTILADMGTKF